MPVKIATSWYNASVDVTGKHLSGLLLVKNMPDSSVRIVFTSESGVTFFDFGFDPAGNFKVYSIIRKMDYKPLITTFRKDFSLVLGLPFQHRQLTSWSTENEIYFGVAEKKETAYFITNKECSSLQRLELGSRRKRKVTVKMNGAGYPAPDTVNIVHHLFPMQIQLVRFSKE